MKQLLFLFCVGLLFTNCSDDLDFNQGSNTLPEELANTHVYFSDTVLDNNQKPIAGAQVAVYASSVRYSSTTNEDGEYSISVPSEKLPQMGFISVSVTKDLFKPANLTYAAPLSGATVYNSNTELFSLDPCPTCLTIGEKSSELFHLGDDNYSGSENSQFQKSTDGVEMAFHIEGSKEHKSLNLSFQIKGIQPDRFEEGNKSSIQLSAGGEIVAEELLEVNAPEDGSFGMYEISVDNAEAITSIKFITSNHGTAGSDYDDWEFTCLYVQGAE